VFLEEFKAVKLKRLQKTIDSKEEKEHYIDKRREISAEKMNYGWLL
jgi:hypothetical protein